ncbi:hypothetical protein, partial [Mesorhizobium sp.]|uniref:hypothetical protein n=1 Tax=Mesorhizobium sp. TaxID=1871066 RepID=UPI0025E051CC
HSVGHPGKSLLDHANSSKTVDARAFAKKQAATASGSKGSNFSHGTGLQSDTRQKPRRVKKHLIGLLTIMPVRARKPVPPLHAVCLQPLPLRHPRMAEGAPFPTEA